MNLYDFAIYVAVGTVIFKIVSGCLDSFMNLFLGSIYLLLGIIKRLIGFRHTRQDR